MRRIYEDKRIHRQVTKTERLFKDKKTERIEELYAYALQLEKEYTELLETLRDTLWLTRSQESIHPKGDCHGHLKK